MLFLFKLPIKCCVIHSSEKYSPHDEDDGWIHRPRYLPMKWLHPNTIPSTTTTTTQLSGLTPRQSTQLTGLVCCFLCLFAASTSCHASHDRGGQFQLATGSLQWRGGEKIHKCSFISISKSHQTDPLFPLGVLMKHTSSCSGMKKLTVTKVKELKKTHSRTTRQLGGFSSKRRNGNSGMFPFSTPS